MQTNLRRLIAVLVFLLMPAPPASAQAGPPPEVRAAVDATVAMLESTGDGPITTYIRDRMTSAPSETAARTALLRSVRAAVQGKTGEGVGVERAPDGVILELSGTQGTARVHLGLTEAGRVTRVEVLGAGGGSEDGPDARPHLRALEDLPTMSLDAAVAAFERDHLSAGYMTRTPAAARRAAIENARSAVANASAVTVQREGDAFTLNLRGGVNSDIVITLEPDAPNKIDTLEVRQVTVSAAPALTEENLAQTFDTLASQGFSGTVFVEHGGRTLLHNAYGIANTEFNTPVTLDTVFGIGSTPIDFTIASILLLEQRGVVNRNDRITRYFPDVPRDKRQMTIEQLMTGRSGLPDFVHTDEDWNPDLAWEDRIGMERRILTSRLRFAPGQSRAHSHAAFGLLAALIERVSGQTYYAFIRQNFLDPAGMTRTGLYGETRGLGVRDFAVGPGPSIVGAPNIPPNWGPTSWLVMGSGGMYSTLEDMRRFFDYVRSGAVLQGQYLERYGRPTIGIGGSDQGFYLFYASNGSDGTALMLINMEGRSPQISDLSEALATFVGAR
ncbi:MAG: serine hydrolase domain-containing protein [Hyphomonadaceae bacterium]